MKVMYTIILNCPITTEKNMRKVKMCVIVDGPDTTTEKGGDLTIIEEINTPSIATIHHTINKLYDEEIANNCCNKMNGVDVDKLIVKRTNDTTLIVAEYT